MEQAQPVNLQVKMTRASALEFAAGLAATFGFSVSDEPPVVVGKTVSITRLERAQEAFSLYDMGPMRPLTTSPWYDGSNPDVLWRSFVVKDCEAVRLLFVVRFEGDEVTESYIVNPSLN